MVTERIGDFMINLYISSFKDVIKSFYSDVANISSELESAKNDYNGKLLQSKIDDLNTRKNTSYNNAKKLINDIYLEVRTLLAVANYPVAEKITEDTKLFELNSIIELTPQEVEALATQYNGNYMMLRYIKGWIEKNPKRTAEFAGITKKIYLPEDKVQVYKKFADSALNLVDTIYNSIPNTLIGVEVEAYADESFCAELFSVIGDGADLKNYKTTTVPEIAKRIFDDYTIGMQYR
jgi:hypothetical protein